MKYEVKLIGDGKFGETVFATDNLPAAKTAAREHNADSYWGTAIIDTEANTADFGCCTVPASKAFECHAADCVNAE